MKTLVDFSRLESFTDGDRSLEGELYELFLEVAAGYLDDLGTALDQEDEWSGVAHGLKGAAGNIGAVAIAEMAAEVEKAPPDATRLDELRALFAATRQTIRLHLA